MISVPIVVIENSLITHLDPPSWKKKQITISVFALDITEDICVSLVGINATADANLKFDLFNNWEEWRQDRDEFSRSILAGDEIKFAI